MPIKLQCPECKTVSVAPAGRAGQHVRCKRCNTKFAIPQGAPTLPVAPGAAAPASLVAGAPTLIDRYEVRELLGAGSYGSVYRAFDPRLGREVALKVLRAEMTSSPQAVERFLREAKAAAKLDHPNIVAVFDAGRAGDVYFIASAFIKCGTLASSIPQTGMEPRRAAELTAQLASALGYAHRQGVVHRDVKPANILLDEQGSLRLMDFGLAGWTQDECTRLTQQGAVMGTPAYMAPEQASGDTAQVGPASDLYSAGVVLYELVTGRRPFGGDNAASMMYQIVHTTAPAPSARRPGLDGGLDAICVKAMAKKPADRFGDGEAMATALRAWAPTAILVAVAIGTKPAAGSSSGGYEWDKETVDHSAVRPDGTESVNLPTWMTESENETVRPRQVPANTTTRANPRGLNTAIATYLGPKRRVWTLALAAGVMGLAALAVLSYLLLPPAKSSSTFIGDKTPDEFVNSFGMRLKLIKPGAFLMGSPQGETGQSDDEKPQHLVEITRPYYLGVYTVTQWEYVQVTGQKNPSWFSNDGGGKGRVEGQDTMKFPVEQTSWDEAADFCRALNRKDTNRPAVWKYTLPTEAEWEYACRAGSKTAYFFGSDFKSLDDYAWYLSNSGRRTHAVGGRLPNAWGLHDMNGNVLQWCADWYGKDYQDKGANKDPQGPATGLSRVLRGGSWDDNWVYCRAAFRNADPPSARHGNCGFRICLRQD